MRSLDEDHPLKHYIDSLAISPRWAAPEVILRTENEGLPSLASDVYSFGMLCCEARIPILLLGTQS